MAAQVVDALKAVEVEDEERVAAIAGIARSGGGLEARQQRAAVGKPGQRILHRELAQPAHLTSELGGAQCVQAIFRQPAGDE
jgi:hypothetical protein